MSTITVTSPATIAMDTLTISAIHIAYIDNRSMTVNVVDKQQKEAQIILRDGDSSGLTYAAGVWAPVIVKTANGMADGLVAFQAGLSALSTYLLTAGLLVVDGGAAVKA